MWGLGFGGATAVKSRAAMCEAWGRGGGRVEPGTTSLVRNGKVVLLVPLVPLGRGRACVTSAFQMLPHQSREGLADTSGRSSPIRPATHLHTLARSHPLTSDEEETVACSYLCGCPVAIEVFSSRAFLSRDEYS